MPHKDGAAFMARLMALPRASGRDALMLTVLTATRSGKVRHAVRAEFDLDKAIWSIPALGMKVKKPHVVLPAVMRRPLAGIVTDVTGARRPRMYRHSPFRPLLLEVEGWVGMSGAGSSRLPRSATNSLPAGKSGLKPPR